MRVAGIDPGSTGVGICILDGSTYVGSRQIFSSNKSDNFYIRAADIRNSVVKTFAEFGGCDVYGIESPWVGFNPRVAILLGIIKGIIIAEIFRSFPSARIYDITPLQVRNFFGLPRGAKKPEVHSAIDTVFRGSLKGVIEGNVNQDELDSIGIAMTTMGALIEQSLGVRNYKSITNQYENFKNN